MAAVTGKSSRMASYAQVSVGATLAAVLLTSANVMAKLRVPHHRGSTPKMIELWRAHVLNHTEETERAN